VIEVTSFWTLNPDDFADAPGLVLSRV